MKNLLAMVVLLVTACSSIEKKMPVTASHDTAVNTMKTVAAKLNYDISTSREDGILQIKLTKYGGGKLIITIPGTNDNPVLAIRSYNSDADGTWVYDIFSRAFAQELSGKRLPGMLYTSKKSYLALHSLNLLNSGFGLFYSFNGHPYMTATTKWCWSVLYTGMDVYGVASVIQGNRPHVMLAALLVLRLAVAIDGSYAVRNYNDIVSSGYAFPENQTSANNNASLLIPVFARRF